MSILSQLLKKQITFDQAAGEVVQWGEKLVSASPALKASTDAAVSDLKQSASNAVDLADSTLATYLVPATEAIEVAAETALAAATGGKSVPFNPLIVDGIDRMSAAMKAVIDAEAAKLKASLTGGSTAQPT